MVLNIHITHLLLVHILGISLLFGMALHFPSTAKGKASTCVVGTLRQFQGTVMLQGNPLTKVYILGLEIWKINCVLLKSNGHTLLNLYFKVWNVW